MMTSQYLGVGHHYKIPSPITMYVLSQQQLGLIQEHTVFITTDTLFIKLHVKLITIKNFKHQK